jgi:hypothetical protein
MRTTFILGYVQPYIHIALNRRYFLFSGTRRIQTKCVTPPRRGRAVLG